ncbi:MAG: hypothetical protein V8S08_11820 [Lachnoclostridium sp.]
MDKLRAFIGKSESEEAAMAQIEMLKSHIEMTVAAMHTPNMKMVINGTGDGVLHTNLGRAPIGQKHMERVAALATGYSNLNITWKLEKEERDILILKSFCERLPGAEAAMAVNNNAAANGYHFAVLLQRRRS